MSALSLETVERAIRDAGVLRDVRELDSREADGLLISLLWDKRFDLLWVSVYDTDTDERVGLVPVRDRARALDVFQHPFAYAMGV